MYIISPWWFYLIGVAEGIKAFFLTIGLIGLITVFVIYTFKIFEEGEIYFLTKKIGIIFFPIMIIIGALIPNKETCYSMAIASVVTTENLDYAAEADKNIVEYITEKAIELIEAGE